MTIRLYPFHGEVDCEPHQLLGRPSFLKLTGDSGVLMRGKFCSVPGPRKQASSKVCWVTIQFPI